MAKDQRLEGDRSEHAPGHRRALAAMDPQVRQAAKRQLWALALLSAAGVPAAWLDVLGEGAGRARSLLAERAVLEETGGADQETVAIDQETQATGSAAEAAGSAAQATSAAAEATATAGTTLGPAIRIASCQAEAIREDIRSSGDLDAAVGAALEVLDAADPERITGFHEQRAQVLELVRQLAAIAGQENSAPLMRLDMVRLASRTLAWAAKVHVAGQACVLGPLVERLFGVTDPGAGSILAVRDAMASVYLEAGEKDRARAVFERHLDLIVQAHGLDHPASLASRNSLAYFCGSIGDLASAVRLYRQVLAGRERVLGAGNRLTISTRNNLAYAYGAMGEPATALPLCQRVATDTERLRGPDHPETLASRNNLAYAYEAAGQLDAALTVARQTLADCLRVLGPSHRITRTVASLLDSHTEAGKA